MDIYTHIHTYAKYTLWVCITYIHTYIHSYIHGHIYTHTHTHKTYPVSMYKIHTYIHTYIYIHTHTHSQQDTGKSLRHGAKQKSRRTRDAWGPRTDEKGMSMYVCMHVCMYVCVYSEHEKAWGPRADEKGMSLYICMRVCMYVYIVYIQNMRRLEAREQMKRVCGMYVWHDYVCMPYVCMYAHIHTITIAYAKSG
jgi:hypothetical protein